MISGAVCVQAAIKKWKGVEHFEQSGFGIYNEYMGKYQFDYLKNNIDLLQPHFLSEYGMDLASELESNKNSYITYHKLITVPMNGYKDAWDYVRKAAPYDRIPMIKTPTMFLNSINDPFMGEKVIDYDIFKKNPNVVLATNKYAGHMGYHEQLFSMKQWHGIPSLDFLETLRD